MDDAMHSSIQMTPWEFEDVVLYRSLSGAYAAKVWALERGQSFTNHGYSSCAFDIRDSMSFDKAPVLLVIKIPRGTPFLYIDGLREAYCRKNRQEIWAFKLASPQGLLEQSGHGRFASPRSCSTRV
jgi:hypothetical protein